ncbi:MAG: TolC family outer membrane protein [Lentisphaeraceae bacterium]|nr:TolC family outer membrane protein [Lentisphaeraceae bacterium]
MRLILFLMTALFFSQFPLFSQDGEAEASSLEEAVRGAIKNHPALSAARKASEASKMGIDEARGEMFPSVDLRSAGGREQVENSTVINDGDQHRTLTRFESSLLIRQNLYTGGRVSGNIEKRRNLSSESFYLYLDEKEKTAFNAIDAYIEYCRNRSLIKLADNNVKIHEEILATVNERFKRGMSREADVIQVKGRLALAKAQYQRELANREAAKEQFRESVGADPAKGLKEPSDKQVSLPKELKEAKNNALSEHPSLKARKHNVAAANAAVKETKAAFQPQVAVELRAAENDNIGGTRGNDDAYSAMLVVTWNIFRGGSDKAATAARLFEAQQGEDLLLDEKRKIARNIGVAWHDYKGILVELNYFLQHEKASKETMDAFKEQYKLNQRTLFDLLNAQNELFLASSRVIETNYSKLRAMYSIFANMGNVTTLFEVQDKQ